MPIFVTKAFIDIGTPLDNGADYVLTEDISMSTPFTFSGTGSGPITFDGSGHTITVTTDEWLGLFSQALSVSNLGILSSGSTFSGFRLRDGRWGYQFVYQSCGWFFASSVGGSATNCYSTGTIGTRAGGIFGESSEGTATNCYSTGAIGNSGGGIFGLNSNGTTTNCYSTGAIGNGGGGIFGFSSNGTATNCYSTGAIGRDGGGIFGVNSYGTATNCYSTGTISFDAGPIFGPLSTGTATNCYSTNGGLWLDADPNNNLLDISGHPNVTTPAWFSFNNVPDTPYLLVANPQPLSDDDDLLTVVVNGEIRVASNNSYAYTFNSTEPTISISIVTEQPHAFVQIQDLSGGGDLSGPLTGLHAGVNNFTITVTAQTGATTTYPLTINTPSNDDDLSLVSISGETVNMAENNLYSYSLNSNATSVHIHVTTNESNAIASIVVSNLSGSNDLSGSLPLGLGLNFFMIHVVAQNGATTDYLLTIMNPSNNANLTSVAINNEALTVNNLAYSKTFNANASPVPVVITAEEAHATIAVTKGNAVVLSGNNIVSDSLALDTGLNTFTVTVTAQDGTTATYTLAITNMSTVYVDKAFIQNSTPLLKWTNYIMTEDVSMSTPFTFSGTGSGPITFDGSGHTITVTTDGWPGLFSQALSVSNLGILSSRSLAVSADVRAWQNDWYYRTAIAAAGWFFASDVGGSATDCYSTGPICENGGGIFGKMSNGRALRCYSTGAIGQYGGGIFGSGNFAYYNYTRYNFEWRTVERIIYYGDINGGVPGSAINCYSTGTIGPNAGPIFGMYSSGTATHCHSTNGGLWLDAVASNNLLDISGHSNVTTPAWFSFNNVPDTPYLLVANPQPPSDDDDLLTVVVNGSTRVASNNSYAYVYASVEPTISISIVTEQPHAIVQIQDLSGGGDLSGPLTLHTGSNRLAITVTAQTGATAVYPLTIYTPSDNLLASILVNGVSAEIVDSFCSVSLPSNATSVALEFVTDHPDATVSMGESTATNRLSTSPTVVTGPNFFVVTVVAPNGSDATYHLTITNPPSSNANLTSVAINNEALTVNNLTYSKTLNTNTSSASVVITAEEPHATISVTKGDTQVLSGNNVVSGSLPLNRGPNTFTVTVTAEDATTKTYTLAITNMSTVYVGPAFIGTDLLNWTNYIMTEDVLMATPFSFAGDSAGITFDGSGHTITVTTDGWPGLFSQALSVSNLGILSSRSTAASIVENSTWYYTTTTTRTTTAAAGWFFASGVGGSATDCYSTGPICESGGGIFGKMSNGRALRCYSTGAIGVYGGGIFGSGNFTYLTGYRWNGFWADWFDTYININGGEPGSAINCYSTGTIGPAAGPIFGLYSSGTATHCYSTNGGLWLDADPNNNLVDISGHPNVTTPVWFSFNNVPDTPYLLVANPQLLSDDDDLLTVKVNGVIRVASNNSYAYTFNSTEPTISISIVTEQPHAFVQIQDLSGGGDLSGPLTLIAGVNNFTITVTAQTGATTAYPLTINTPSNDDDLSLVSISGETVNMAENNLYSHSLNSNATSVHVHVTTNESHAIASIVVSNLSGSNDLSGSLPLSPGLNLFTIHVVAQNGAPTDYLLAITNPSNNTNLTSVAINDEALTVNNFAYSKTFNANASSASIVITAEESHATISVTKGDTQVLSGNNVVSDSLALDTGLNTFTVTVTAQDGTTNTYTLAITNPSNNANLTSIAINDETLSVNNLAYSKTFNANASPVPVVITAEEPHATISVTKGDTQVLSGNNVVSGSLPLNRGPNTFTVTVTAEDATTKTYTLAITNMATVYVDNTFIGTDLLNWTNYIMTEDVLMATPFSFAGDSAGITFDGSGHTITVTTDGWPGLFSQALSVSNLGILSSGSTYYVYIFRQGFFAAGWFFASGVGGSATDCYSTGAINIYGGGIFGMKSNGHALRCYSTGAIGIYGGGIFGYNASGSATNCYSTGTRIGPNAGPIFGLSSSGSATHCHSTNGGLWLDADASNNLLDISGHPNVTTPAWFSFNNVPDTPYLLVANPQPLSDDDDLLTVVVNGEIRVASNNAYAYTFNSTEPTISISIVTEQPHAFVQIQDLSGGGDLSGPLTGLHAGVNNFTITVTAQTGATTTYPLTINTPSNDDDLSLVSISGETVNMAENNLYSYSLNSNATSVHIHVTTNESNAIASIVVSNLSGSNDLSGSLSLGLGLNFFMIHVVAQNGATTDYLLTIMNPSNNANLTSVAINNEALTVNNLAYSKTFNANASPVPIVITAEESHATIAVTKGNAVVLSGNNIVSDSLALDTGLNTFTVTVTAQDRTTNTYTLAITNMSTVYVDKAFVQNSMPLSGWTNYIMTEDVSMSTPFTFSGTGSGPITFDGSGHTITVTTDGWLGLFSQALSVSNLGILSSRNTFWGFRDWSYVNCGWFFDAGVGGSATDCYSIGVNARGIFGSSSSGTALRCYSTGVISPYGGGIFSHDSTGSATACYSTGSIGEYGGGIFGTSSRGTAINCYSTGTIGPNAGPIFGQLSTGTATHCHSTNGGLWLDADASNNLLDISGHPDVTTPVWYSFNNVPDTPYLLVANPQLLSDDDDLLTVVVNGEIRVASNNAYAYTFNSTEPTISISIVTEQPHAFVQIQDLSGGGDLSGSLALIAGVNNFTITVTAQTGATTTYPLTINTPSNDDDLSLVSISGETVNMAENNLYSYSLNSNATSVHIHVTTNESNAIASIVVSNLSGSNDLSGSLPLGIGLNFFTIHVVAQNGANATYHLTIMNPSNNTNLTSVAINNEALTVTDLTYSTSFNVNASPTPIVITAEDVHATISVTKGNAVVLSGNNVVSGSLVLNAAIHTFTVTVTAQNGESKNYVLSIDTRSNDATLNVFTVNDTDTLHAANDYILQLPFRTTSVSVYAIPTSDYATTAITGRTGLVTGLNTVTVLVTAQNGDSKSYSIKITVLPASNDTTLSIFTVNGTSMSLTANENTLKLAAGTTRVTVNAHASDNTASVAVTGRSGLVPGANTLTVQVTAQNGDSALYTVKISIPLAVPTLTMQNISDTSANISWTRIAYAATYNVYQSIDNYTDPIDNTTDIIKMINTRAVGPLSFKVAAVDSFQVVSALSSALLLKWPPAAPTQVVATSTASSTVKLRWTPPADTGNSPITSYRVYSTGTRVSTNITFDASSATLTGLTDNVHYKFTVSAVNNINEGPQSTSSNTIVPTSLSNSISSFLSSGSTAAFTTALALSTDPVEAILNARVAIKNASNAGILTPAQRNILTTAALTALNPTNTTKVSVATKSTNTLIASLTSTNKIGTIDPNLLSGSVLPSYFTSNGSLYTASINLNARDVNGNSYADIISKQLGYLRFELPAGSAYQLTLINGAASLILTYDGTVLRDQNSKVYTANDALQVGDLRIPLLGLGSFVTTTTLSLVTVNSSTLIAPYALTVPSNSTSASVAIQPTNPLEQVAVLNSAGATVLGGSPGNVSGSLTLGPGINTFTIRVTSEDGTTTTNVSLTLTNPSTVPCFPAGTRILTPSGYKTVETLVQNELVLTADGRQVPVKVYGKHIPVTNTMTAPYKIPKGVFGLTNDIVLSPDHAFQIRKGLWMLPRKAALLSDRVEQVAVGKPVTYYHLECPQYLRDNLVANGNVVESYAGKQLSKSPYTYSESLKGYTRSICSVKHVASA